MKKDHDCHVCKRGECGHAGRFPAALERLLSRCVEVADCWIYTWPTDNKGYSRLRGDEKAKVFGHRFAWRELRGEIPDGLTYDHLCQNPPCVNPWHGDLVPDLVNIRRATRGMGYVNRSKTHCPASHPLIEGNLVASIPGRRICRICRNETNRRYRARKKAVA